MDLFYKLQISQSSRHWQQFSVHELLIAHYTFHEMSISDEQIAFSPLTEDSKKVQTSCKYYLIILKTNIMIFTHK